MTVYSNHISHSITKQNVWEGYEGDEDIIDLDIPIEDDTWENLTDEDILSNILQENITDDTDYDDWFFLTEDYENTIEDNWYLYGNLCGENCIGCGYCYDENNNTRNDNEYENEYKNEYDINEDEHNNDNNNDNTNTNPPFNCHFLHCDPTICDGWCSKI